MGGQFPRNEFSNVFFAIFFFSIGSYHFANEENNFLRISREYDVLFQITNNNESISFL